MIARVTGRLGARGSGVGARESISERGWVVPAAVEGAAVAYVPAVGIGLAAGTFVMAAVVASDQPASRLFLGLLLALLTGYMFLGRGLAHVGVGPAYVGDVVLVAAVLVLVFALARPARFDVLHGLLIVYILLGAALTVPYLGTYGLDALRDGVTWIYALFAIAVSVIVLPAHFERITAWYRRILPLFLLWVPLAYYLDQIGTPALPGSDVSAVVFKGGDIGVHLAGVAAFILLGLAATGAALVLACRDKSVPTGPDEGPDAQITDGLHSSGKPHFYFLPPMVSAPAYAGTFDPTLTPTVQICVYAAGDCSTVIAQLTPPFVLFHNQNSSIDESLKCHSE